MGHVKHALRFTGEGGLRVERDDAVRHPFFVHRCVSSHVDQVAADTRTPFREWFYVCPGLCCDGSARMTIRKYYEADGALDLYRRRT